MTNDFKEKLLAYLTGKLKKETGNNTPQFGEVSEVGNNLYTYLSTNTFRPYPKAIIRGKNSTGEDLDIYLLYGNDRTENDTYEGFIVILDKNYMPIQFINQFTSGVRFGNIEILKVGDNGRFYGVELTTETTTRKRFLMLNNILVKNSNNYEVRIRMSYNLDASLQISEHYIADILKKPGGSNYVFVDNEMVVVEFKINVGAGNEWNVLTNNTGLTTQVLCSWASWDSEDNLSFKLINYASNKINVIENTNYQMTIKHTYNAPIVRDRFRFINGTMLNANDIYFSIYADVNDNFTYNVYIYKIDNGIKLIGQTNNQISTPAGFSNYIYMLNDGKNAYVSFNLPQTNGNRFYLGLITGNNVYFDDIGLIAEYSSLFVPFISSQFNLYSFFIQNDNKGYLVKTIFNNLNYNGVDYENINSLVPNSGQLFNQNNIVIFARNLYNRIVNNNTTISTLEVPNDMLNDEIISIEKLMSETNTNLVNANEKIETNIYETIDINFYNTIYMRNDNNPQNSIINGVGASRLNDSTSKTKDYDNARATKIKINYSDNSSSIYQLDADSQITLNGTTAVYKFLVYNPSNKSIVSVEIISQDENTTYQTITLTNISSNKIYEITQNVEVL